MSRIRLTEQAALHALHGAERVVDLMIGSIGLELKNPALVELRRVAVYGQALLLVEGCAKELTASPRDVAAALRRLVTPTAKEQREAAERRQAIERLSGQSLSGAS